MNIPISTREYTRHPDGSLTMEQKGWSPFMVITTELLDHLATETTKDDGFIDLPDVRVWILSGTADYVLVVKDSIFGRIVHKYHDWQNQHLSNILEWEHHWNPLIRRAVRLSRAGTYNCLPWLSVYGLLCRTRVRSDRLFTL